MIYAQTRILSGECEKKEKLSNGGLFRLLYHRVKIKENEKRDKYVDLDGEMRK